MADTSADLRRRADMARFNREANDRAPTEWFASLSPKQQARHNRELERRASYLERLARTAAKREARAIIQQAKRKA